MEIKKAVFPVAGFGTRFLPATKSTPKEMLPRFPDSAAPWSPDTKKSYLPSHPLLPNREI